MRLKPHAATQNALKRVAKQMMKMPMRAASATSNFMIGVTAAASAVIYYWRGGRR